MGNPLKGEVVVKAGEESLVFSYSVEALYRLEQAMDTKIGVIKKMLQDEDQFSMGMLRTLFWAALIDSKGVEFELDDVGPILSKVRPQVALEAVTTAFIGAFSEPEPVSSGKVSPPREPSQKKIGTGSVS